VDGSAYNTFRCFSLFTGWSGVFCYLQVGPAYNPCGYRTILCITSDFFNSCVSVLVFMACSSPSVVLCWSVQA